MTRDVASKPFPHLDEGSGPVLLFLHGIFGSPLNWYQVSRRLAHRYRVIRLEFPIFSMAPRRCTVSSLTQYVEGFVDSLGLDRFVVVGNSLGGHVALDLALRHPEAVRALVLSGSSGLFERTFERGIPANPDRDWIADRLGSSIFFDPSNLTDEMVDEAVDLLGDRENRLRLIRIAASAKRDNLADALPSVQMPALLVWGMQDRVTPIEIACEFRDRLPRASLVLVDNCGHAPMLEQPEAFAAAVERFLTDLAEAPDSAAAVDAASDRAV